MARNITYLLGAGASYHAIPTVDSLNTRMKIFLEMFDDYTNYTSLDNPKTFESTVQKDFYQDLNMKGLMAEFKEVVELALLHRTVDTYAKKLYLKGEESKLLKLKSFLCCYFAFEQCRSERKIARGKHFERLNTDLEKLFLVDLDYRYDVFLASLLQSDLTLPDNIKIVSWNYDHQLELAYIDYSGNNFNSAKKRLNIFPFVSSSEANIIKLNGSADFFTNTKSKKGIPFTTGNHHTQYIETLQFMENDSFNSSTIPNLKFAWEDDLNPEAQLRAIDIMNYTDELIIIGYSFPYFNRSVDKRLIQSLKSVNIKIQCNKEHFTGIQQNLVDIIGEDVHDQIKYHDDLDQFYIPMSQF